MPERSGLPALVRGGGADGFGLPSAPTGMAFGRLRHCAAAGTASSSAAAVASLRAVARHFAWRIEMDMAQPFSEAVTNGVNRGLGRIRLAQASSDCVGYRREI